MKKTPCEIIVWNVLPCIRKKLAKNLMEKGLSQKEVAKILGLSSAAISQYMANKRGKNFAFNGKIEKEIEKSAKLILDGKDPIEEICRICNIIKKELDVEEIIC